MRSRRESFAAGLVIVMLGWLGVVSVPVHAASGGTVAAGSSVREVWAAGGKPPVAVFTSSGAQRSRQAPLASAATLTIPIHHYNLCAGNESCFQNPALKNRAKDLVTWFKAADSAWFISLNEVCRSDVQDLVNRTNSNAVMVASLPSARRCGGDWYGNAILHPGGVLESYSGDYFPTQENRPCGEVECRTYLCLKLGTYAGPMSVCTAHLETHREDANGNKDYTIPKTQAAEYLWIGTAYAAGRPKVLAGDFNLRPDQLDDKDAAPAYFTGMRDLVISTGMTIPTWRDHDQNPATLPRPATPESHIDYIWIDRTGSGSAASQPYCDNSVLASDHCYTSGAWFR